ncbi:MAG: acyltransferase family protein, partial [Blautia sp.]|nr:acyltransferase family protein [Blautia sp.]
MKKRVTWIDVAKFFGIFCIYVGHFGQEAGLTYPFVFFFHVPLFFFLSGCTESMNPETSILGNLRKKVKGIFLPYLFFVCVSLVVHVCIYRPGLAAIRYYLLLVLKGCVRNSYIDGSLWFLTCLFVISILFLFLRQIKRKPIILGICLILYYVSERLLPFRPAVDPRWIYNIDSACYYLIYYCLGYLLFEPMDRLFQSEDIRHRILLGICTVVSVIYAGFLYFGKNLLAWMYPLPVLGVFGQIGMIMLLIWLVSVLSYLCRNCLLFQNLGKNTLYMCGNEGSIKLIFSTLAAKVGFYFDIYMPVLIHIYSFLLLLVVHAVLVPLERPVIMFFR